MGKSGPLQRARLANQIQVFRILDRWEAGEKLKVYSFSILLNYCTNWLRYECLNTHSWLQKSHTGVEITDLVTRILLTWTASPRPSLQAFSSSAETSMQLWHFCVLFTSSLHCVEITDLRKYSRTSTTASLTSVSVWFLCYWYILIVLGMNITMLYPRKKQVSYYTPTNGQWNYVGSCK